MSKVFLARAPDDFEGPSEIVLKVWQPPRSLLNENSRKLSEMLSRLMEEGRLGARLDHPALVRSYGARRDGDIFFLVHDYVDGATLGDILDVCSDKKIRPPLSVILDIAVPILRALHYAHFEARREDGRPLRVVHRDIKPENIMVGYDGSVKLLDLGIARSTSLTREVTVGDFVLGTRHYMSPEQVFDPESVGHRADLFSMAVIVLELCTLRPTFPRTQVLLEFAQSLSSFHFSKHEKGIDALRYPGLRPILAQALATDPANRFESTGLFADRLEGLRRHAPDSPSLARFMAGMEAALRSLEPAHAQESLPPSKPSTMSLGPDAFLDDPSSNEARHSDSGLGVGEGGPKPEGLGGTASSAGEMDAPGTRRSGAPPHGLDLDAADAIKTPPPENIPPADDVADWDEVKTELIVTDRAAFVPNGAEENGVEEEMHGRDESSASGGDGAGMPRIPPGAEADPGSSSFSSPAGMPGAIEMARGSEKAAGAALEEGAHPGGETGHARPPEPQEDASPSEPMPLRPESSETPARGGRSQMAKPLVIAGAVVLLLLLGGVAWRFFG